MIVWLKDFKCFIAWNLRYLRYNLANTCAIVAMWQLCLVTTTLGLIAWQLPYTAGYWLSLLSLTAPVFIGLIALWGQFLCHDLSLSLRLNTCVIWPHAKKKMYSVFNRKICSRHYILNLFNYLCWNSKIIAANNVEVLASLENCFTWIGLCKRAPKCPVL